MPTSPLPVDSSRRPQVLVLSTLHQYHAQASCYGFSTLRAIIAALAPDLLLLEVSEEDLRTRPDERIKREYPEVVYPLLAALGVQALALEPSGDGRHALIERMRAAESQFRDSERSEAHYAYVNEWFKSLVSCWRTPADVNSTGTDAAVFAKHAIEKSIYPPDSTRSWEEWNQHFLDQITNAVNQRRPRLALVLVGLEHSHWLRSRLARRTGLDLLDAQATLGRLQASGVI
jgi:hypothetical protein